MQRSWILVATFLTVVACEDDDDDTTRDAGQQESDAGDDGDADAGEMDAATDLQDGAVEVDASQTDAGADSGAADDAGAEDAGTDASVPLESFTALYNDILGVECASCHDDAHPSNLNLSTRALAFAELVGVDAQGSQCGSVNVERVTPGDPDGSLLIHKIEGADEAGAPVCGSQMPLGEPALSPAQIARFRTWIEQGAPDN